jgi:hypothetical protein
MNKTNCYTNISDFGSNAKSESTDPLTYCLGNTIDQRFLHGGHSDTYGQDSRPCQIYLAEYCSTQWDDICEVASRNKSISFPNNAGRSCGEKSVQACYGLNSGETLIHNTAKRKYLVKIHGCVKKYEPFDPTVASSPLISYWVSETGNCIPVYGVDPTKIDDDPVMNKILAKPTIAFDVLINIYNTMKRKNTLSSLKGTKLGMFYSVYPYFKNKGGM